MKKSKKEKIDLSIIILNYNSGEFLENCLNSVFSSEKNGFNYEVIVVDNASTDNSIKKIEKFKFKGLIIIKNKKNLGFSAGNNIGVKKAKGRYLLFLNPDTLVKKNTFKEMIKFMDDHPEVGVATCRVELPNGKMDEACHRGFPTPWNAFCHFSGLEKLFPKSRIFSGYILGWKPLNEAHEIDAGAGAFLIVRREAGEKINWWDEDYFWYGEDLDFCYRIKKLGWKIYYFPKVKIIHFKGITSGIRKESQKISLANKETKIKAIKASTSAMRIFYRKHYLNKYPRFITWLVLKGIDILEKIRLKKLSI
ncbi:MAG: glycosyltransferase family 2 protein [Microgenomates group bacterium]